MTDETTHAVPICPHCGSEHVQIYRTERRPKWALIASFHEGGVDVVEANPSSIEPVEEGWWCTDCDREFETPEQGEGI